MMKGVLIQPQMEENKSNLTSASFEVSGSSSSTINKNDHSSVGLMYPPEYFSSLMNQPDQPHTVKKKRNQPCQPGPDAEVIAYSPRTLLSTNRFVCEICNKGFQRDQNLQLHRRGHNLPWKLKKRTNKEGIRKKVYVCPDKSCAHHDPSRALGDLTGIKKHFFRKHGEKKWKCERCSKRYAVQSDWKAHSKICGTREYICECGTLFSRKDSFMSHRGFCDVSLEARQTPSIALNNNNNNNNTIISSLLKPSTTTSHNNDHMINFQQTHRQSHHFNTTTTNAPYHTFPFPIKREQQNYTTSTTTLTQELPPWIAYTHLIGPGSTPPMHHQTTQSPQPSLFQDFPSQNNSDQDHHKLLNPHPTTLPIYYPPPPPTPHHEEFVHSMRSYEIIADHNAVTGGGSTESGASAAGGTGEFISPSLFQDHDMMMMINNHHTLSNYASAGFEGLSFQSSEDDHNYENLPATGGQFSNMTSTTTEDQISGSANDDESGAGVNDEMTRDFLGLKSLFQNDYPMEYNWFKGLFEHKGK